jgi:hypothetical protein
MCFFDKLQNISMHEKVEFMLHIAPLHAALGTLGYLKVKEVGEVR